jgi:hypothetical protein
MLAAADVHAALPPFSHLQPHMTMAMHMRTDADAVLCVYIYPCPLPFDPAHLRMS